MSNCLKKILVCSFILSAAKLSAQDIHFTMYDILSTAYNPANTGNFKGDYRIAGIHRNQWRSVTIPFVTTGLSFEIRSPLKKLKNLHAGIQILSDKAGDSQYSTFKLNPSVSYQLNLTKDSIHQLKIGLQSGFTQRSINYNFLRFDNQYNGYVYDPSLNSGENFTRDSRLYGDVNLGLLWQFKPDSIKGINVGIAWMNINKPQQTFYSNSQVKLDQRAIVSIDGFYKINSKITLLPAIIFMPQGKYREIFMGTNVKYQLPPSFIHTTALYAGVWFRAKDAYAISLGMDYRAVHVRASYDINFSDLMPASNRRGAFELGVVYIYKNLLPPKNQKFKRCPDFM